MHTKVSVAIPEEHTDFIEEFKILLEKYPEAKESFVLAHLGDATSKIGPIPRWTVGWECEDIGDHIIDCKPVARPE
ncbi:hypothetical protein [Rhizobium sp. Root1220]|uniref:hypothetical protein n=1 Tax=Rhizobium sp. Root1220 TaxID=1736432 RepID=UPI000701D450|nr:hypothetical protein [Rhizobium sp. Root1220]KQV83150.1 hypothetical protein ASC90_21315 [Rhizobium sp. Root1220]